MADPLEKPFTDGDRWLIAAFVEALLMSLEAMTSERPQVSSEQVAVNQVSGGDLAWFEQPFSAASGTLGWVAISPASRDEIGRRALVAAGIDDATPEDCESTWKEILGQVLSGVAQALGRKLRREVNCGAGRENAAPPEAACVVKLAIRFEGGDPMDICFAWNQAMHQVVEPEQAQPPPQASAAAAAAGPAAGPAARRAPNAAVENSRTLDLLLEVEMPVSVSFGRAQMALKDVLKLATGSIVELNRSIAEPVDIIVNNCVIARGEVVVVEGNYGVRIKQIISKEERLRTLY